MPPPRRVTPVTSLADARLLGGSPRALARFRPGGQLDLRIPPKALILWHGVTRTSLTVPVSATETITAETVLEPPDPASPVRYGLPVFRLGEHDVDGVRRVRVALRDTGAGWTLTVEFDEQPRPGSTERVPDLSLTPFLVFVPPTSSVARELPLELVPAGPQAWTATLPLGGGLTERDTLIHALTRPDYRTQLVLRCTFPAAVPMSNQRNAQPLFRPGTRQVDVVLDRSPFVFDRERHPYVFAGVGAVGADTSSLTLRTVRFGDRVHQYYQDGAAPHRFFCLPDAVKLRRRPDPPHVPDLRVRFTAASEDLMSVQATVEYVAAPVTDSARLADAARQLAPHLPQPLPPGVTGAELVPVTLSDPAAVPLVLQLPRATGAGVAAVTRTGILTSLTEPFADQLPDLTLDGFQSLFDALLGTSAVVFTGGVQLPAGDGRPGVVIPFIARLDDLAGPVFDASEVPGADGSVVVSLRNETPWPVTVRSIPAQLVRGSTPVATSLVELTVDDRPASFPAQVPAAATLAFRLRPEATARTRLRTGDTGDDVAALQRALTAAGHALDADGDFGARTERAVRAFQTAAGLEADGVAGPRTLAALGLGAGQGELDAVFVIDEVEAVPDRDELWDAIVDATVPALCTRTVTVVAVAEMFTPHTDVSAIAVAFDGGGHVVVRPGQLEATAAIRVPVRDLVLRSEQQTSYGFSQVTIRGDKQQREQKTGSGDILVPEVPRTAGPP